MRFSQMKSVDWVAGKPSDGQGWDRKKMAEGDWTEAGVEWRDSPAVSSYDWEVQRHPIPVSPGELLICGNHCASRTRKVGNEQQRKRRPQYYRPFPSADRRRGQNGNGGILPAHKRPGGCICDYIDYPMLYDERVDQRPIYRKPSSVPVWQLSDNNPWAKGQAGEPRGLFRLPAEIRTMIWEAAVVSPHPIEFCAEPFAVGQDRGEYRELERGPFDRTQKPHHLRTLGTAMKLFRISRQARTEVQPLFFSQNEFRFTNAAGWIGLLIFLWRIGLDNAKLLRSLIVCHPCYFHGPVSNTHEDYFWDGVAILQPWRNLHQLLLERVDGVRWFDWRHADAPWMTEPWLILPKLRGLRHLRVVVPRSRAPHSPLVNHHVDDDAAAEHLAEALEWGVQEDWFDDLTIAIVDLALALDRPVESQLEHDNFDYAHPRPSLAHQMVHQHNGYLPLGARQWQYLRASCNGSGCYDLEGL